MSIFLLCNKDHRDHGQGDHGCDKDHKRPCFHYAIRIVEIMVRRITDVIRIINVHVFICNKNHRDHGQKDHGCNKDHKHTCFHCAIKMIEIIVRGIINVIMIINVHVFIMYQGSWV